jgi:uronate dehydrogenase
MERLNVLLTGAGGNIGKVLTPPFKEWFNLRLLDKTPIEGEPDTIIVDLQDRPALDQAMQGIDVVLHLAAYPNEADFLEVLVPNNVVGLYNTFEAAKGAGVRRLIFASTVQTIGNNPPGTVRIGDLPNPWTLYGATKLLGEAMGRQYHHAHGLEFIAVRIGAFQPYDSDVMRKWKGARDIWLSPRDAVNIFRLCIEKPDLKNETLFASSITEWERMDRTPLRQILGYTPQDDIRQLLPELYPDTQS